MQIDWRKCGKNCKQWQAVAFQLCGLSFLTTNFDIGVAPQKKGFVGSLVQYLAICLQVKDSVLKPIVGFCKFPN